jgi:(p)ppGpp synthase/HD superfamily hydrolase
MKNPLATRAKLFAIAAHGAIDHRNRYTGAPYHEHLERVAELVASVSHTDAMLAASWLHDCLEDTPTTIGQMREAFGETVATLVLHLSDVSRPEDGNRATRKDRDLRHLAGAPAAAQTIKLADLIDNTATIIQYDPRFARVYLPEKRRLLQVLHRGDAALRRRALGCLIAAEEALGNPGSETIA